MLKGDNSCQIDLKKCLALGRIKWLLW